MGARRSQQLPQTGLLTTVDILLHWTQWTQKWTKFSLIIILSQCFLTNVWKSESENSEGNKACFRSAQSEMSFSVLWLTCKMQKSDDDWLHESKALPQPTYLNFHEDHNGQPCCRFLFFFLIRLIINLTTTQTTEEVKNRTIVLSREILAGKMDVLCFYEPIAASLKKSWFQT